MNNRAKKRQFRFIAVSLLAISTMAAFLVTGCSNEPSKTEATPPAAAPGAPSGPGAPPPAGGAVAGGGVGERINK